MANNATGRNAGQRKPVDVTHRGVDEQHATETNSTSPAHESPATQDNGQSTAGVRAANIVIFGETGVGKSSVINLIVGRELASTSNDARGCTSQNQRYPIQLETIPCAVWDTSGLDEAVQGTVPTRNAETHLRALMRALMHSGGITLIIYCTRGNRLTRILKRYYDLFYVTICRSKVPIALVVTGLENQEGEMETWWTRNEAALRQNGMHFDAHACVTTIISEDPTIQKRRSDSQKLLRQLIREFSVLPPWSADLSSISRVIRSAVRELSLMNTPGNATIARKGKVIVCDSFTTFLPGTIAVWIRSIGRIGDRQYEFLRVDKHDLQSGSMLEGVTGADVLVFYTSPLVDDHISPGDVDALKRFHDLAGGQFCPVIVVLRGCNNEHVARRCYIEVTTRHSDIRPSFVSFPNTGARKAELDEMIERLCTEHIKGIAHGPKRYIKRFLSVAGTYLSL